MKIDFIHSTRKKKKISDLLINQLTNENKYEKFKMVNESYFINNKDKAYFNRFYQRNIRFYLFMIKTLSRKYQNLHRVKFDNDLDLALNPLRCSSSIYLFHHNRLYGFDIFDLLKIIKNALTFSNGLFIESMLPKNPYNNKEFSVSNLINIYLYMYSKGMNIPLYFEMFRKSGFDINIYIECYEPLIKLRCIKNFCNDMTDDEMYGYIIIMLRSYKLKSAIIHPEFSKEEVINQFKPYLEKYFIHCYSYHPTLQIKSHKENKRAIQTFFNLNPNFGRIIYMTSDPRFEEMVQKELKYKYLNYLSQYIPDYNFFDDIRIFNTVNESIESSDYEDNSYFININALESQNIDEVTESEEDDELDILLQNPDFLNEIDNHVDAYEATHRR